VCWVRELNPGTQALKFLSVLEVLREELDVLNPRRLAADLAIVHVAIRERISAYDPGVLATEIGAILKSIADKLKTLNPAALLGDLSFLDASTRQPTTHCHLFGRAHPRHHAAACRCGSFGARADHAPNDPRTGNFDCRNGRDNQSEGHRRAWSALGAPFRHRGSEAARPGGRLNIRRDSETSRPASALVVLTPGDHSITQP
jgi:hypothetical protein